MIARYAKKRNQAAAGMVVGFLLERVADTVLRGLTRQLPYEVFDQASQGVALLLGLGTLAFFVAACVLAARAKGRNGFFGLVGVAVGLALWFGGFFVRPGYTWYFGLAGCLLGFALVAFLPDRAAATAAAPTTPKTPAASR